MTVSKRAIFVFACFVLSATCSSLSFAWGFFTSSMGLEIIHSFFHPFLLSFLKFVMQLICLLIYFVWHRRKRHSGNVQDPLFPCNPMKFLFPTITHCLGALAINVSIALMALPGLKLSSGVPIFVVALLSKAFLNRKISLFKWLGIIVMVFDGIAIITAADILQALAKNIDVNAFLTSEFLLLDSHILLAVQTIYEEYILKKYDVPLVLAFGLEGLFGTILTGACLVGFYFINYGKVFHINISSRIEDPIDAFYQMANNKSLIAAVLLSIISELIFRVSSLWITKAYSGMMRAIFRALANIPTWVIVLLLGWHNWHYMYLIGLLLFIFGVTLYFELTIIPLIKYVFGSATVSGPISSSQSPKERSLQNMLIM